MKSLIEETSPKTVLEVECLPDWARLAWGVAVAEGATDQEIERLSAVKKSRIYEDTITYREWWHILFACKELIGDDFYYLAARPVTIHGLGWFGTAMTYASTFEEAANHIESWAKLHEPINSFIKLQQDDCGGWFFRGDYSLSGWTRTAFAISAAKIAVDLWEQITMTTYPEPIKLNCDPPKNSGPRKIKSVFTNGVEFDHCLPAAFQLSIPVRDLRFPNPRQDAKRFRAALEAFHSLEESHVEMPTTQLVQAMQYTATSILSTDQVADRLHLSRKALTMRLAAENTTPKQIADQMAFERYKEMQPFFTKSEITRRLGYSDARALTRLVTQFEKSNETNNLRGNKCSSEELFAEVPKLLPLGDKIPNR